MNASKVGISLAAAGALATGIAVYQWSQASAAATELAAARREHAALVARGSVLEQSVVAAQKERGEREAALEKRRAEIATAAATPAAPVDDPNAKFREIMNELTRNDAERRKADEEYQQLRRAETFRPLFRELGCTTAQMEQALDIMSKPDPEAWTEFRAAFGAAAAEKLTDFRSMEATLARGFVNELSAKLYFLDTAFTLAQAEQLHRLIKNTSAEPTIKRSGPSRQFSQRCGGPSLPRARQRADLVTGNVSLDRESKRERKAGGAKMPIIHERFGDIESAHHNK
ncbi:MAG: hypothetical protein Q7S40_23075 [Opitutaceae bacterium]|nr:hypothetical protein [Opitutaceae bacterium]